MALFRNLRCAARFALSAAVLSISPLLAAEELPPPVDRKVRFAKDVQPLFKKRCVECHSAKKKESGLRLDDRDEALNGGDSGPVWSAGESADSLLIKYVAGLDPDVVMPPKGDRLTRQQIAILRAWIDQGAEWPTDAK